MKICLITPAPPSSRKGNRMTALRWRRLLKNLGHSIVIQQKYDGTRCDMMIALHARKSSASIAAYRNKFPKSPLIVTLTGTDLYRDIHQNSAARHSLEIADGLIILQAIGIHELPEHLRSKARVVHQSVSVPATLSLKAKRTFDVCVIGHLRQVKDPFRTAIAVRKLPQASRVRVLHAGAALSPSMQKTAEQEMRKNFRYHWLGELPHWKTKQLIARSHLMVLSSIMEGGAHVISEAAVLSTPVLASHIAGSIGLLGEDYHGYFPVQDTDALTQLLLKAENEPEYLQDLKKQIQAIAHYFDWQREQRTLQTILKEFTPCTSLKDLSVKYPHSHD